MSDSTPSSAARAWRPLDAVQRRVLGVLIEKAKTTPAGYPMSANAIVAGSNQKNNRDPVMTLDTFDAEKALDELRRMGAVSEIDWVGRVAKYKHHAYEWLGVDKPGVAVMTELLLRGDQSVGDLRARAARMEPLADVAALMPVLEALMQRGLVTALTPPGRGQIVGHRLYLPGETRAMADTARSSPSSEMSEPGLAPARPAGPSPGAAPGVTDSDLAELRAEIARLGQRVSALERRTDS